MPTIVDALTDATAALNAAVQRVVDLQTQINASFDAKSNQVTNYIQNFYNRPLVQSFWVNPLTGNDANDGSTPALAKATIDSALDSTQNAAISIMLLADATLQRRHVLSSNVSIQGVSLVQAGSSDASATVRTLTLLGEATNSPLSGLGRCCAGAFFGGTGFVLDHINISQQDVPAAVDRKSHFELTNGGNFICNQVTHSPVTATGLGTLLGSPQAQFGAWFTGCTWSGTSPGRIFANIAAGGNPNSDWHYRSNLTSA